MKYCWNTNDEIGIGAPSATVFSVFLFSNFIKEACLSASPMEYIIKMGLLAVPIVFFLLRTAFVCARRYELCETGITVFYPLGIHKFYFWQEFTEIAICKIHYASATTEHRVAIRCVIGEEKRGPKKAVVGKEWWSTMEYEVIHFERIISIYKTDDRIAEFHKLCPHPIKDYRYLEDRA